MTDDDRIDTTHRLLSQELVYRAAVQSARRPVPRSLLRFLGIDDPASPHLPRPGRSDGARLPGSG